MQKRSDDVSKMQTQKILNNKNNGYAIKATVGTLAVFVFGILVFFAADLIFPFRKGPMMTPIIQNLVLLGTLLSTVALGFSLYLIYTYLKNYLEVKNELMLGLLLAVCAFMMFAISTNPIMQHAFGQSGVFSVIALVFACVALGALVWISAK